MGLEKVRGAAGAHLVALQANDPFANVHVRVRRTLGNDDVAPGNEEGNAASLSTAQSLVPTPPAEMYVGRQLFNHSTTEQWDDSRDA